MKLWVYYIGKPRDASANAIAAEFVKRSSRYASCEMREIHPDRFDLWGKHAAAQKVLLDPAGKLLNSAQFVELIAKGEMEGRDQSRVDAETTRLIALNQQTLVKVVQKFATQFGQKLTKKKLGQFVPVAGVGIGFLRTVPVARNHQVVAQVFRK